MTYRSERARAWRNLLVGAINAALEQALFSLKPGDHRWPAEVMHGHRVPFVYGFTLPCGLAARAQVTDIGYEELSCVAWVPPPPGYAKVRGHLRHDGVAWARGWLERRRGIYLRTPLAVPEPEDADPAARPGGGTAARLRRSRPARPMTVMTLAELDDRLERWRWDERGPSHAILARGQPDSIRVLPALAACEMGTRQPPPVADLS